MHPIGKLSDFVIFVKQRCQPSAVPRKKLKTGRLLITFTERHQPSATSPQNASLKTGGLRAVDLGNRTHYRRGKIHTLCDQ